MRSENAACVHLHPQLVALAATLADAGEHGIAAVRSGNVVYELLNEHGFADACAAEKSYFAALCVGLEEVNCLDARLENLDCGALVAERGRGTVYFPTLTIGGFAAVYGLAEDIEHPAKHLRSDGDGDAAARWRDLVSAAKSITARKHDATHLSVAEMLGNFQHLSVRSLARRQGVAEARQIAVEFHIDDRPRNCDYPTFF